MRVLFFGRLQDAVGKSQLDLEGGFSTIEELRAELSRITPELAVALQHPSIRVAVDRAIIVGEADLSRAAEVAFMPPLSGG